MTHLQQLQQQMLLLPPALLLSLTMGTAAAEVLLQLGQR
jgi:hypothetical protein